MIRPPDLYNDVTRTNSFRRFEEPPYTYKVVPQRPSLRFRDDQRPRPPLITTSVSRLNSYPSLYANEPSIDGTPVTLPYMYGAGDGWNTPCLPQRDSHSKETNATAFPFPPTDISASRNPPTERLTAAADTGRHERVPSAAFEYQEFETSLRSSARLSGIVGTADNVTQADKENAAAPNSGTPPNDINGVSHKGISMNKRLNAQRESGLLRSMQSLERLRHSPLIESPKPLSIGRNHPGGRPLVLTESNNRKTTQHMQYHIKAAGRHDSNISIKSTDIREQEVQRPCWTVDEQPRKMPRDAGMDSFGDSNSYIQDLA